MICFESIRRVDDGVCNTAWVDAACDCLWLLVIDRFVLMPPPSLPLWTTYQTHGQAGQAGQAIEYHWNQQQAAFWSSSWCLSIQVAIWEFEAWAPQTPQPTFTVQLTKKAYRGMQHTLGLGLVPSFLILCHSESLGNTGISDDKRMSQNQNESGGLVNGLVWFTG